MVELNQITKICEAISCLHAGGFNVDAMLLKGYEVIHKLAELAKNDSIQYALIRGDIDRKIPEKNLYKLPTVLGNDFKSKDVAAIAMASYMAGFTAEHVAKKKAEEAAKNTPVSPWVEVSTDVDLMKGAKLETEKKKPFESAIKRHLRDAQHKFVLYQVTKSGGVRWAETDDDLYRDELIERGYTLAEAE
ncbi:hypothetical protein G3O90_004528 [Salmonella enterica]|nr:hypothetical protein [Salmonella enterica]